MRCIPRKYKRQWLFMVYHERALHNCFIPCHGKYSDQHNQCDIRVAHDGKIGVILVSSTLLRIFCSLTGCVFCSKIYLIVYFVFMKRFEEYDLTLDS